MRILLAEDDSELAAYVVRVLEEDGNAVTATGDGAAACRLALKQTFDAVILDVMLPQMDGFEITSRLRAVKNRTPILLLTARDAPEDIVRGLDAGADDYLTKPFSFDVLLARLRARTRDENPDGRTTFADLILNSETHEASRAGTPLRLTPTEFGILKTLLEAHGRVVTRQRLIDAVWGTDREIGNNNLDAFMRLLRAKVDAPGRTRLIQTVRGIGYSLRASDSAA